MSTANLPEPGPPDPDEQHIAEELGRFGFDDPAESWVARFREATAPGGPGGAGDLGTIGPYRIVAEIARGGQGVVYRARRQGLDRELAIKRLRSGALATDAARRRFEREIELASALAHPSVVNVFAVNVIDGEPILAMEWIDGVPITEWADGRSTTEILHMFLAVCDAVQHAHQRGVIHRDLKPSNILVDRGPRPAPHVLDFGLAKDVISGDATSISGSFVGTPAYASPEQVAERGADIDVRCDVYALGVLLFEMLTGTMPYPVHGPLVETLRAIQETEPRRASAVRPGLDREIDAILGQALAKDKDARYQSAARLADDVRRHLDGRPVLAHRQSRLYLLGKLVRRHRLACASIATATAIVLGLTATLAISRHREARARTVAERTTAFLMDTLAAAGPARFGNEMTVRELLEDADRRAAEELADHPAIALEVYATLGSMRLNLWDYEEAAAHLRRAVALSRELHGDDGEQTARWLTALSRALASSRDAGAVDVAREALAIRLARFGDDDPRTAESRMRLGYALYITGDPADFAGAREQLDVALATLRRHEDTAHRDLAACLHIYGYLLVLERRRGRDALLATLRAQDQRVSFESPSHRAVQLYAEALDVFRRRDDLDDPYYADLLHTYPAHLLTLARYAEAEAVLEEAVPLVDRMHGPRRTRTLLHYRVRALCGLGRYDEAEATWRRLAVSQCAALAERFPDRAEALRRAGSRVELAATGDAEAWRALLEAAAHPSAAGRRALLGLLNELGTLLVRRGDLTQADALFAAGLDLVPERGGLESAEAATLEGAADVALETGAWDAARRLLERALAGFPPAVPWSDWRRPRLESRLGQVLLELGEVERAEPMLVDSFETLLVEHDATHPEVRAARARVVELYERTARPARADRYRAAGLGTLNSS